MRDRTRAAALCLTTLLGGVLGTSSVAHAGAWTQPEGEYYAKAWALALVGAGAFDADGDVVDVPDFQLFSLNYYAEYGLFDRWTILSGGRPVGYAAFDGDSTPYVGEVTLGVRRGFLDGPVRLGVEAQVGYQGLAGDENLAAPTASYTFTPAVASATAKIEGQLGVSIPNGWIALNAGIKGFTSEDISPAIVGMFQVGYTIAQTVTLDLHAPINIHTGDKRPGNITGSGESDYIGLGLGASWWLTDHFAVNAGVDGVAFATSNLSTPALTLGVEFR